MPRARRKPSLPAVPAAGEDWGADTAAARAGTIFEQVPQDANRRRRRRRLMPWEDPAGLGAHLTPRQRAAAAELHERHVRTQLSPSPGMVFVDRTPDYGGGAVIAAEAQTRRAQLWGGLDARMAPVLDHVCGLGLPLRSPPDRPFSRDGHDEQMHRGWLKVLLDVVANRMGI